MLVVGDRVLRRVGQEEPVAGPRLERQRVQDRARLLLRRRAEQLDVAVHRVGEREPGERDAECRGRAVRDARERGGSLADADACDRHQEQHRPARHRVVVGGVRGERHQRRHRHDERRERPRAEERDEAEHTDRRENERDDRKRAPAGRQSDVAEHGGRERLQRVNAAAAAAHRSRAEIRRGAVRAEHAARGAQRVCEDRARGQRPDADHDHQGAGRKALPDERGGDEDGTLPGDDEDRGVRERDRRCADRRRRDRRAAARAAGQPEGDPGDREPAGRVARVLLELAAVVDERRREGDECVRDQGRRRRTDPARHLPGERESREAEDERRQAEGRLAPVGNLDSLVHEEERGRSALVEVEATEQPRDVLADEVEGEERLVEPERPVGHVLAQAQCGADQPDRADQHREHARRGERSSQVRGRRARQAGRELSQRVHANPVARRDAWPRRFRCRRGR